MHLNVLHIKIITAVGNSFYINEKVLDSSWYSTLLENSLVKEIARNYNVFH